MILKRAITTAQARDKVKRNAVSLCELPKGKPGPPSKSLTLTQNEAVLKATEQARTVALGIRVAVATHRHPNGGAA
ncbi:hypothetical protein [Nonomuraea sp. NPDC005650]|uniref:hypothetical protein n=1 Tax=Nonomuraea sp. NPDC005650 TaxID=3157045 RepID=UPI0033B1691E